MKRTERAGGLQPTGLTAEEYPAPVEDSRVSKPAPADVIREGLTYFCEEHDTDSPYCAHGIPALAALEQLTAENETISENYDRNHDLWARNLMESETRATRYQEALERVRSYPGTGHDSSRAREMQDIARAALHPEGETP